MDLESSLRGDVTQLLDLYEGTPENQVIRRAFVRGAWGYKEGCLYGVAAFVSKAEELADDFDAGRPADNERTLERVKAILKWCGRRLAPEWQPDFSGAGWQDLRHSLRIRNRLMHPKNATDLDLSDEDMDQIRNAMMWFMQTITDLQLHADARSQNADRP